MTTDPHSKSTRRVLHWLRPKTPPGIRNFLIGLIPALVALVAVLGFWLPGVHNQYGLGALDKTQDFQGILMAQPVPHLAIPRQGDTTGGGAYSRYLLSAFNKAAFNPQVLKDLSGQWVTLKGLPVYRDQLTLLASGGATAADPPTGQSLALPQGKSLGEFTLSGEIVDSKCYLGRDETRWLRHASWLRDPMYQRWRSGVFTGAEHSRRPDVPRTGQSALVRPSTTAFCQKSARQ